MWSVPATSGHAANQEFATPVTAVSVWEAFGCSLSSNELRGRVSRVDVPLAVSWAEFRHAAAHAEMEAIRDAARRLRTRDLSGCLLVSTSPACRMCEAAAAWASISRMVYGEALTDAGAPR